MDGTKIITVKVSDGVPEFIRASAREMTMVDWEQYEQWCKQQPFIIGRMAGSDIEADTKKAMALIAHQESLLVFMFSPMMLRYMMSVTGIGMLAWLSCKKNGISKDQIAAAVTYRNHNDIAELLFEINDLPFKDPDKEKSAEGNEQINMDTG